MTRLLSEIPFGAFLAYSPNGSSSDRLHAESQRFRYALKQDGLFGSTSAIELAVRRLREIDPPVLASLFGADVVAVPVPRSSPFPPRDLEVPLRGGERDFLWVPRRICDVMNDAGLVGSVQTLLVRERRVVRSSTAAAADRPRPQDHLDSLGFHPEILNGTRILIVDDIVTRGSTLLAAASLVTERGGGLPVHAFALLRAISNPREFVHMRAPVSGMIHLRPHGDTLRRP